MTFAVESDIGAANRHAEGVNEDSVGTVPITLTVNGTSHTAEIVVVADGAGGHDAGELASYLAVSRVTARLVDTMTTSTDLDIGSLEDRIDSPFRARPVEVEQAIEAAIGAANEDILTFCADERIEAHTTVAVGVRIGGRLHYGWVGDSPIYLINRQYGRIEKLTHDHSTVQEGVDAGEIDDVAALVHPNSNQLRRALGGSQYASPENQTIEVETATVELFAEDVILVASDGLVDAHAVGSRPDELFEAYQAAEPNSQRETTIAAEIREFALTDADIKTTVLKTDDLQQVATNLIELANEYGGKDNVTVALLQAADLQSTPEPYPTRGWTATDISAQPTIIEDDHPTEADADTNVSGADDPVTESNGEASSREASESVSRPAPESQPSRESSTRFVDEQQSRDEHKETGQSTGSVWSALLRWFQG